MFIPRLGRPPRLRLQLRCDCALIDAPSRREGPASCRGAPVSAPGDRPSPISAHQPVHTTRPGGVRWKSSAIRGSGGYTRGASDLVLSLTPSFHPRRLHARHVASAGPVRFLNKPNSPSTPFREPKGVDVSLNARTCERGPSGAPRRDFFALGIFSPVNHPGGQRSE